MNAKKVFYTLIAKSARKVTEKNVNSCCMYLAYQDQLPAESCKLKKNLKTS